MIKSPDYAAFAAKATQQRRLQGKVAVVTGIGSGIGKEVALTFARQGAQVMGAELNAAAAEETLSIARTEGLSLQSVHPVDLTTEDGAEHLIAQSVAQFGGVDILVNAAAFAIFEWMPAMSFADWRKTLQCELDIVFLACRAVWPQLIARNGGVILNFASVNAHRTLAGSAAIAHTAGKGGVLAMTRQLAMEGAPHGIRANTISPGFIETGATRRHLDSVPELLNDVLAKKMLKRIGQPSDIAWMAVFLCSEESSWVTASDFYVDGGAHAW